MGNGSRLSVFLESIKFSHSIFALPFALTSMVVAAKGWPGWNVLLWIIIACVGARTAAMAFNRLADRKFDARNPRTQNRPTVTGQLSPTFMSVMLVISSATFIFAAGMLNTTCFILSLPVLGLLFFYSLTKRFTNYSHYFLGLALGLAPLGAWVAVQETLSWVPVFLSVAVIFWVTGFDILYSCQDYDVDCHEEGLHSLPKKLGMTRAMNLACRCHGIALVFFLAFWFAAGLDLFTLFSIMVAALIMKKQHELVTPKDLSRINAAFFTANGLISILFFLFVVLDFFIFL